MTHFDPCAANFMEKKFLSFRKPAAGTKGNRGGNAWRTGD